MSDAGEASREVLHSEIVTSLANQRHNGVVCAVRQQDVEVAEKQVFVQHAKKAKERAEERLNQKNLSDREQRIAEAKLRRALVRLHVTNEE